MGKISDAAASKALKDVLGNVCFSKATLAINAGGAATIKTTGTTTYTVGGIYYTKAALSAQSIAIAANYGPVNGTDGYVQPVSSVVYYVVSLDAAGTVYVRQGSYLNQVLSSQGDLGTGAIPDTLSTQTPIGYFRITTNGATTFTPGTTLLDAAGITAAYTDVALIG